MMWLFLTGIAGLTPAQWINIGFAALCVAQCLGLPMRGVALIGAALYLGLVLI